MSQVERSPLPSATTADQVTGDVTGVPFASCHLGDGSGCF